MFVGARPLPASPTTESANNFTPHRFGRRHRLAALRSTCHRDVPSVPTRWPSAALPRPPFESAHQNPRANSQTQRARITGRDWPYKSPTRKKRNSPPAAPQLAGNAEIARDQPRKPSKERTKRPFSAGRAFHFRAARLTRTLANRRRRQTEASRLPLWVERSSTPRASACATRKGSSLRSLRPSAPPREPP